MYMTKTAFDITFSVRGNVRYVTNLPSIVPPLSEGDVRYVTTLSSIIPISVSGVISGT